MLVERKRGDVIDRRLNCGCAIAVSRMRDHDAGRYVRNLSAAGFVAAVGIVRHAVAVGLDGVDQPPLVTHRDGAAIDWRRGCAHGSNGARQSGKNGENEEGRPRPHETSTGCPARLNSPKSVRTSMRCSPGALAATAPSIQSFNP